MIVARSSPRPSATPAGSPALIESRVFTPGEPLTRSCGFAPGCIAMIPSTAGIERLSASTFATVSSPWAATIRAPESLITWLVSSGPLVV